MLNDEMQSPVYFLFDHSYKGGSWNGAVIEQAAALKKRAEAAEEKLREAEAECDRLKRENDALRDVKDRLLPVSDAFFALRQHVYGCEDCADDGPCGRGDELWTAAITACDVVYGEPGVWAK